MAPKSVLITGCSKSGIGSALAFELQRRGLRVIATARNTAKIDPELVKLPNVELLQLDVVSSESILAAVRTVDKMLDGRLDILFNNSGRGLVAPFADTNMDDARQLFDVNFRGMWDVTQAFLPLLLKARGLIVNHASTAGYMHLPYSGFYAASKAAVTAVSETMRLEMAPFGVRVIALETGIVRTGFFENLATPTLPKGSMYEPVLEDIQSLATGADANAVAMPVDRFARKVADDILSGATGLVWRGSLAGAGSWILALTPTFLLDMYYNRMAKMNKLERRNS